MAGGKEAEVDRMVVRLIGDASGYQKMMRQAISVTKEASKAIDSTLTRSMERVGQVGRSMSLRVTLPLIGLGAAAIKAGSDFESGFAGVRKTVEATEGELANLRLGFQKLLTEIPMTSTELLAIGESAGQLGVANDKILDFTKTIAMLGVTTNLTAEEGGNQIAKFANIVGMSQDKFSNFGSSLVALGNASAANERDIMAMAMRLAGAGNTAGMAADEILALATSLSEVGIEAEMGGSALSTFMLEITKAVAKGGEDLDNFAKISGKSSEGFAADWRTGPTMALRDLMKGLAELDKESRILALEELGVDAIRMTDALTRLSPNWDRFTKNIKTSNASFKENKALAKEAEQRFATFASQVTLLKNKIGLLLSEGFEIMRPTLIDIGKRIEAATTWFKGLTKEQKTAVVQILAVTAALGPMLVALRLLRVTLTGGMFGLVSAALAKIAIDTYGWEGATQKVVSLFQTLGELIPKIDISNLISQTAEWITAVDRAIDELALKAAGFVTGTDVNPILKMREQFRDLEQDAKNIGKRMKDSLEKHKPADMVQDIKTEWNEEAFDTSGFKIDMSGTEIKPLTPEERANLLKRVREVNAITEAEMKKSTQTSEQKKSIDEMTKSLKKEMETWGMTRKELALYEAQLNKATPEQLKMIAGLEDQIAAKEKAKEATDEAREAEKRFRDSFKTGGIEGVGRGLDALARLEESRNLRAGTSKKSMEATILAETSGKGGGGKTAANPLANVAAFLNPEQQKMELLYLKLISEDTKRQADKETITLKPAGLGRSGS